MWSSYHEQYSFKKVKTAFYSKIKVLLYKCLIPPPPTFCMEKDDEALLVACEKKVVKYIQEEKLLFV